MAGRLAENIRAFRRQRSLTQAQLAEALGVTVGAVYKWENGLSQPELDMLVALADFFDASVDALLGYEMKDNRLHAAADCFPQAACKARCLSGRTGAPDAAGTC